MNDGSVWINAYQSFCEALQVYNGCVAIDSALIAAGTYLPRAGTPFIVKPTVCCWAVIQQEEEPGTPAANPITIDAD